MLLTYLQSLAACGMDIMAPSEKAQEAPWTDAQVSNPSSQQPPPHEQQRMLTQDEIQRLQTLWVPQPFRTCGSINARRDHHR